MLVQTFESNAGRLTRDLTLRTLTTQNAGRSFFCNPTAGSGNFQLEARNADGGLTYLDWTNDANRDFDARFSLSPDGTTFFFDGRSALTYSFTRPTSFSLLASISAPAGSAGALRLASDGVTRWEVGKSGQAESGGNAGSNFWITRFSDAGAGVSVPLQIERSTGRVILESLAVLGRLQSYDGSAPANGELLIGAGSSGYLKGFIAGGPGIQVVNTAGGIEVSTGGFETHTANHTLTAADNRHTLLFTNTTPVTLTIPDDGTIPVGYEVTILVDRVVYLNNQSVTVLLNRSNMPSFALLRGIEYRLRREATGLSVSNWSLTVANSLYEQARVFNGELLGATALPDWLVQNGNGTGSTVAIATGAATINVSRPGAIQLDTGSTATGWRALNTTANGLQVSTGIPLLISVLGSAANAPDGTNDFQIRLGFQDTVNSATAPGVFFRCTSTQNGGLWQGVARTASTESVLNTSESATVLRHLQILWIPGVAARFYSDDTYLGELTTNLPPSASRLGVILGIHKTVGTTNRLLYLNRTKLYLGT